MVNDIVPELLEKIQRQFEQDYGDSEVVRSAFQALKAKKANYTTVNDFALELGKILSSTLTGSVSSAILPDGKMYYNIAERILNTTMTNNHELIADYTADVQELLNKQANIHLKSQKVPVNQDKIAGIINRISSENDFDSIKWILGEPIVNFSQSIVDESIKKNAEFQYKAGLSPEIVRKEGGKCCDWCREVVGSYTYPKVPKNVYRRHDRCRCTVEYDPKNSKVRDVWSKLWRKKVLNDKIEERKKLNTSTGMSKSRKVALQNNVKNNPIKKHKKPLTELEIINNISGGDLTGGSCSSAAFAYIGNKAGFDVLDFRGGYSRKLFAVNPTIREIAELPDVVGYVVEHKNDYSAINQLLKNIENGREYYLATGRHAAIIRKLDGRYEYLELQDPYEDNGFHPLTNLVFNNRFKCSSRRSRSVPNMLIEVESLGKNDEFQKLLGYINTKRASQQKGNSGVIR